MNEISSESIRARVERLAEGLRRSPPRVLGLLADNGPEWIVADLAAELAGVPVVPLPGFFTPQQLKHAVASSGMDALFCALPDAALALGFHAGPGPDGAELPWFRREASAVELPAGTSKITFTSGTTGTPKPVFLGAATQAALATALVQATRGLQIRRHLCLLPLAVLLENVAGARASLLAGAQCIVPPLREVGMQGATRFDPLACLAAIERAQAQSVILLPQMMAALASALEGGAARPASLRFAAVGGAKVSAQLVLRARAAGLPAYEGYGLSECGSVVALNLPGADRPGSVGRPLSHVEVAVASDGEILVSGLQTGDLGRIDQDGFLHVDGRRKSVLITSFGRNVAPEWPEAELCAGGVIAQAVVYGEGQPCLCAVVVAAPARPDSAVQAEVQRVNERLPDYARIAFWIRADAPFSATDGLATANGRARREAVWARYAAQLQSRYATLAGAKHAVL